MSIRSFFKGIAEEVEIIIKGKAKDKIYSSRKVFNNADDSERAFKESVEKLFNVEKWSMLPGITCTFTLYNKDGSKKGSGNPETGDFILINLPGPLPENWVRVIDIQTEKNSARFSVSPSADPRYKDENIEHFFVDEATSTFKVERKGNELWAYEIGQTEYINNKEKDAGDRKVLNTIIAEGGWAGFQKIQWEKLTGYLVHKTELEE